MRNQRKDRRWLLAVAAAVIFPAAAFHASCIAVMGPGTWGSGMQEAYPVRLPPTARILRYADELAAAPQGDRTETSVGGSAPAVSLAGKILESYRAGGKTLLLTGEGGSRSERRHLYLLENSRVVEIPLPPGGAAAGPRFVRGRIVIERWNPWALPAMRKIIRYAASWTDPGKRPEAALYAYDPAAREWSFVMPGHTLVPSPDGGRAVLLRSGAMAAGYYSIHLWSEDDAEPPPLLSLREADESSGRSFRLRWTADSAAVQIVGRTGGFERRKREPRDFNVLYSLDDGAFYDLEGRP